MPRDDGFGAALIELCDDGVAVISHVADQGLEREPFNERREADRVVALAGQKHEAHEIPERIDEGEDLRGQPAFRAADRLI